MNFDIRHDQRNRMDRITVLFSESEFGIQRSDEQLRRMVMDRIAARITEKVLDRLLPRLEAVLDGMIPQEPSSNAS